MIFKKNKLAYFVAVTIGCIAAWLFTMVNPYTYIGTFTLRIVLIVCYLAAILMIILFADIKLYVITNQKIRFKNYLDIHQIEIADIEYIREVWTMANNSSSKEYEIVLSDPSRKPISVDMSLLNKEGKSLFTVLENSYNVRYKKL